MKMGVPVTLVAGLALLAALFWPEARAAVGVWYESTAYSHCFFVLPIALFLAWERRAAWGSVPVRPAPWAALAAVPLVLGWFAAERLGLMEGRQLAALGLLELLFLAVLGWRLCWAFAAPLLYLVFLVPFGAFAVPALQGFTTWFIVTGLDIIGIANFTDGYTIDITAGSFYVAEACAGLRFLIAAIAFGALYACLIYRSPWRRVAFLAACVVIPILANGLRGLGLVVLGHVLGSAEAAVADHILYGWIFFSIVLVLLILAGLPFREDEAGPISVPVSVPALTGFPPTPRTPASALALAFGAWGVMALAGPAVAALLDRAATEPPPLALEWVTPPGCVASAAEAGPGFQRDVACGGIVFHVQASAFAARANPTALFAARRAMAGESGTADIEVGTLAVHIAPALWRLVETETPATLTATALWIDGVPGEGGLADRLALARGSLFGAGHAPVLVAVGLDVDKLPRLRARQALTAFLDMQPSLSGQVFHLSTLAGGAR